jgi:Bifunctional DNA primase/polymerase, N-terminal
MNFPDIAGAVNAALELAARGYPVFPCSDPSKKPTTPNGFKNASTDPEEIRRLWRDHPGGLIGLPTGNAIGLDVLDLDFGRHQEAQDWWRENRHRFPRFVFIGHDPMGCICCSSTALSFTAPPAKSGLVSIRVAPAATSFIGRCLSCQTRRRHRGRIGYCRNSCRSRGHRDPRRRFLIVACSPSWCRWSPEPARVSATA